MCRQSCPRSTLATNECSSEYNLRMVCRYSKYRQRLAPIQAMTQSPATEGSPSLKCPASAVCPESLWVGRRNKGQPQEKEGCGWLGGMTTLKPAPGNVEWPSSKTLHSSFSLQEKTEHPSSLPTVTAVADERTGTTYRVTGRGA